MSLKDDLNRIKDYLVWRKDKLIYDFNRATHNHMMYSNVFKEDVTSPIVGPVKRYAWIKATKAMGTKNTYKAVLVHHQAGLKSILLQDVYTEHEVPHAYTRREIKKLFKIWEEKEKAKSYATPAAKKPLRVALRTAKLKFID